MTKKYVVNQDLCIGCGACVATCPNTFEFDEKGKSKTISEDGICNDEECSICLEICPVEAITEKNKD